MMFNKKLDRAMEWLKSKNPDTLDDNQDREIKTEKKDVLAMLIAAFIVFVPAVIILFGGLILIAKLFMNVRAF